MSDETRTISQPHVTLRRRGDRELLEEISRLVRELQVGQIVVGLPLRMDGGQGQEAERALLLGRKVGEVTGVPVVFADERLTSRQAEREMIAQGSSRRSRREAGDRVAAALLLQAVLAGGATTP